MPSRKKPPTPAARVLRVHLRADGRYETRNDRPGDSPLGVDRSLSMALGTAHREATATSRDERCRVAIEVQQPDGSWKPGDVIDPPHV